jgi:hypothetical protein
MADYPPLSRFYVASYAANDRDYPVVAIRLDPRTAGYKVPEDLSPHPDSKRYPNHVFTGAQPASGDQIVTHIYEILPAPYVPFTRYDDDLGPIQGRRRSVKNEGQVASLASDKRVTYEAREGSAIVYTEIEEAWSVATDDDGNSLFPIRDRDFYDASRGAVQERRQLFVPTGDEEGTLENVNGVITQTSYEPYNEFLSVKIIQTYKVDGPQLVGNATNNEGQLVTVTAQRKGFLGYVPPNPTATKTVEVSREDAESLIERIVDTPEVFANSSFSIERPDPVPQKFRVAVPTRTTQETFEGIAGMPSLGGNEIAKTDQQITKFTRRSSTTLRDDVASRTLEGQVYTSDLGGGIATVTESYGSNPTISPTTGTVSATKENLGNNQFVTTQIDLDSLPELKGQNYDETLDVTIPFTRQFVEAGTELPDDSVNINPRDTLHSEVTKFDYEESRDRLLAVEYATPVIEQISLPDQLLGAVLYVYYDSDSSTTNQRGSTFVFGASVSVGVAYELFFEIKDGFSGPVTATNYLFFMRKDLCTSNEIEARLGAQSWPIIRPQNEKILVTSISNKITAQYSASLPNNLTQSSSFDKARTLATFQIPPTLHQGFTVFRNIVGSDSRTVSGSFTAPPDGTLALYEYTANASAGFVEGSIGATNPPSFPIGRYIYRLSTSPFKFGLVRVEATVVDVTSEMV